MKSAWVLLILLLVSCSLTDLPSVAPDTPTPIHVTLLPRPVASPITQTPLAPITQTPLTQTRTLAPTVLPSPTRTPVSGARTPTASSPALILEVVSPKDESVVTTSTITLTGKTTPGAVVSVNGKLANVDAKGNFLIQVSLDEGPNVIEVVASDVAGNENFVIVRVIYEP